MLTFGHGTLDADALARLLHGAGVELVVDVRAAPASRRHPHVERSRMQAWLDEAGMGYRWEPRLGGRRRPSPQSPNVALRHPAFRGYADHMATTQFSDALDGLLTDASRSVTAALCSESLWWRCHRRLIADAAVLTRAAEVIHLGHDGRLTTHAVTEGARVADGLVTYDLGAASLPGL